MVKTAEFGQPCAKVPESGRCRICGVHENAVGLAGTVSWADETRTLCALPSCVAAARAEIMAKPHEALDLMRPQTGPRYGFAPRRR